VTISDHLHAVAALVAAVAVATLVRLVLGRRRLEVGARQVVQQHLELRPEQILPALAQMAEQRLLVLDQLVEAAIQRILLDQRIVRPEKIAHGALREPLPVQPPFAAGIDQPIAHQRLHDVTPARALARGRQPFGPELVEPELLVQMTRQPAGAPLSRRVKLHRAQPNLHTMTTRVVRHTAIGGKQCQLRGPPGFLVEGIDHPAPRLALAIVDLAEIQHRPLHHLAAGAALALDDAPIAMLLAVLQPSSGAQEHDGRQPRRHTPRS